MAVKVETGDARFDTFPGRIESFLDRDRVELLVEGNAVRGYRSPDSPCLWIRDHSDMLRGGRYFHDDPTSAVDLFAGSQRASGALFDFVTDRDGRENWDRFVRVPVAADVEYRFVKALWLAWQAGGGDEWAAGRLEAADRALAYTMSHPWRWHRPLGLVKRACTIDTWDFALSGGDQEWLHFRVDENTLWGIYHCDNSGLYEALLLLARMHRALGRAGRAEVLEEQAAGLARRTDDLLWQGSFYRHRHPLEGARIPGVDEERQLSLSTPMAINRGLAGGDRARAVLDEYRRRRRENGHFAEWYSIDPPFPEGLFGDKRLKAGAYVNGGIMPLVGGELARAAFAHGREKYGLETLLQYEEMIRESGATYLWYFPDGRPSTVAESTSPEALPTDGWGSSAMLWAFVEGLCGVTDRDRDLRRVELAPRWPVAGLRRARVEVSYAAGGAGCGYLWEHHPEKGEITLAARGPGRIDLHLLLPADWQGARIEPAGEYTVDRVGESLYLDTVLPEAGGIRVLGPARTALSSP